MATCSCRLFILLAALLNASPSFGLTGDKALATVEGEVITLADYRRFFKAGSDINDIVVDRTLLEKLIVDKIIRNAAVRKGLEVSDKEVHNELEALKEKNAMAQENLEALLVKEGMTLASYKQKLRDKLRSLKLFNMEVESKVYVTNKEIEDYYADHKRDYLLSPEKVEIKAVLLKLNSDASRTEITELKRKALRLAAELKEGGSFEGLITPQSAAKGPFQLELISGELDKGSPTPASAEKALLALTAFSMEKGQTSGPIWAKNGVYIFKVLNRTDATYMSIKHVRDKISRHLYETKREKIFNTWIRTLWGKASVIIN